MEERPKRPPAATPTEIRRSAAEDAWKIHEGTETRTGCRHRMASAWENDGENLP